MDINNEFVINDYRDYFKSNDRKIEIPKAIVHIGKDAFKNHTKMVKLTIHEKLKKIEKSAFEGCIKLESIKVFGDSELVVIPEKCFKDCKSLQSFEIPSEVGVIKKYAFSGCTSISHIVIPESIIAIEAGAFDKWTEDQTIEIYRNFKFGIVCKAKIINHSISDDSVYEDEIYETSDGKYMYSVKTKCGHVGRHRYMPIHFPVIATTKKEAAKIARSIPRVKHHHKDAILEVKQINKREFDQLCLNNKNDPYLYMTSKYQQKNIKDDIDTRAIPETRHI